MFSGHNRFFMAGRGFTLVEILMAMAITAIVVTIINMTFFRSHEVISSVRDTSEVYEMVRIAMARMVRDVNCAYLPSRDRPIVEDDLAMYRFIGNDEYGPEAAMDRICFTTASDIGMGNFAGNICEVDYFLKEMEDKDDLYYLIRKQDCTPHYGVTEKGGAFELAQDVVSMNIQYRASGDALLDEWDMAKRLTLPRQVIITIGFMVDNKETSYTAVGTPALYGIGIKLKNPDEGEG
ncbi:MAG: prepilin-type N-terminal cleavage/methylation domain-containing protein [Thermodesulfobacteriota bacterium]|nr:prepilin-type N-terminal cleavage/methylation domain-containing protein [Thermodesulfobacteriota bacterium]